MNISTIIVGDSIVVKCRGLAARIIAKLRAVLDNRIARFIATHGDAGNNEVINRPNYYQLPSGKQLLDAIIARDLSFVEGSALKYAWRAGKKDGEPASKDLKKRDFYISKLAEHYIDFAAFDPDEEELALHAARKRIANLLRFARAY